MTTEQRQILLRGKVVAYVLRKNARAKRMQISIYDETGFALTKPRWASMAEAEKFIHRHADWIVKKLAEHQVLGTSVAHGTRKDYLANKEAARRLVEQRLRFFNQVYKFSYNRVAIRDQKSRWGSCTRRQNLNFNYRLLFLPAELADYVVVHELCHLKELNHSPRFWALVGRTMPDYLRLKKRLGQEKVQVI